jgi:hypothetical protein
MSIASGIPSYRYLPSVLDINKQRKWAFQVSNNAFAQYIFPANSNNTQNIQVNCDIPVNAIVSRLVRIQLPCQLAFTGTTTSGNLLNYGLYDALRQGAFEQILNSQDATINGTKVSYQPYTTWVALQRYVDKAVQDNILCTEPMYPDYFQEYSQSNQYGFSTDPLSTRGNNERPLRGAYNINIVSNSPTAATVTFTIEALISVPPFDYTNKAVSGLVGLNKVIFNFQTTGNWFRMWSHNPASPATISTVALTFTANPQVIMWLYSPAESVAPYFANRVYVYDYQVIGPIVQTSGTTVSAGASATLQSQSFNFDGIPPGILVWCSENPSNWTVSTSDVAARITQLNITWETLQNLLATASEFDLYHISKSNAYNMSWDDFDNYSGSYVLLVPGSSFPLPQGQVVGMGGKRTFQLQAQMTNIGTRSINFFLNILPIYSGLINISQGSANTQINPLTAQDVISAQSLPLVEKEAYSLGGGSFLSDVGNFLTEKVLPTVTKYGPGALKVGKAAYDLYRGNGVVGGRMRKMSGRGLEENNEVLQDEKEHEQEGGDFNDEQDLQEEDLESNPEEVAVGKIDTDKLRKQLMGSGMAEEKPKSILKKTLRGSGLAEPKQRKKSNKREFNPAEYESHDGLTNSNYV